MESKVIHNEDGYTVVEILVALTLLTIISTVVGSVFIFTSGQMNKWRESVSSTNEIHISANRLHIDFIQSNNVAISDTNVILNIPNRGMITYSGIKQPLYRNRIPFADQADSLYIKDVMIDGPINHIIMRYVHKNRTEEHSIIVANRQPQLWEVIPRN